MGNFHEVFQMFSLVSFKLHYLCFYQENIALHQLVCAIFISLQNQIFVPSFTKRTSSKVSFTMKNYILSWEPTYTDISDHSVGEKPHGNNNNVSFTKGTRNVLYMGMIHAVGEPLYFQSESLHLKSLYQKIGNGTILTYECKMATSFADEKCSYKHLYVEIVTTQTMESLLKTLIRPQALHVFVFSYRWYADYEVLSESLLHWLLICAKMIVMLIRSILKVRKTIPVS